MKRIFVLAIVVAFAALSSAGHAQQAGSSPELSNGKQVYDY